MRKNAKARRGKSSLRSENKREIEAAPATRGAARPLRKRSVASPAHPQPTHRTCPGNERLSFDYVAIEALRLSKRALSQSNDRQHRQLMSSISTHGFIAPVVASESGEVIVGEKRLAAARDLGFESVPVVRAHWLTPLQIRQYRIADNKLNELRNWDADALKAELAEIIVLEPEVNIEAMGFEIAEFDGALAVVTEGADPGDVVGSPPGEPLSRPGDIWEVDGHRIGLGDARDVSFLKQVIAGVEIRCVFADPPFNRPVAGHMGGKGRIKHPEFVMASGEMTDDEFQQFQTAWMKAVAEVMMPGGLIYVASDWRALLPTLTAAQTADLEQINFCTWELAAPRMGSFYRSACEYFPIWRKPGAKARNNIMLGQTGRHRSSCWHYPGANSFGSGRATLHLHPTVKPLALVQDVLLDCTARGETVLDPFSGSGTTLIAAERTGRKARVIELDPRYVDVAVRRYQDVIGRAPRLAGTGQTLDDLAALPPRAAPSPTDTTASGKGRRRGLIHERSRKTPRNGGDAQ